jgi:hypothetical protein
MTETIEQRTTWQLAGLAECATPDAHDGRGFSADQDQTPCDGSAGARFLRHVEDAVREAVEEYGVGDTDECTEDGTPWADIVAELADGSPDVYTFTRWQEFVDLAAWQEDASEYGADVTDMTEQAGVCLYIIAQRLAWNLLAEADTTEDDA